MKEKRTFKEFVSENKKKIIIGGIVAAAVTIVVVALAKAASGDFEDDLSFNEIGEAIKSLGEETVDIAA